LIFDTLQSRPKSPFSLTIFWHNRHPAANLPQGHNTT
jgi:hypothetical protein